GSVSHFVGGATEVEVEPLFADPEPFIRLVLVLVLALILVLALASGSGVPLGTTLPLACAGNAASTGDARPTAPEPKPKPKLSTLRPAPTPATAVVGFGAAVWRKLPHAPGGANAPLARLSGSLSPVEFELEPEVRKLPAPARPTGSAAGTAGGRARCSRGLHRLLLLPCRVEAGTVCCRPRRPAPTSTPPFPTRAHCARCPTLRESRSISWHTGSRPRTRARARGGGGRWTRPLRVAGQALRRRMQVRRRLRVRMPTPTPMQLGHRCRVV
ncbi:hypothetical protein B0H14DRAFT_2734737, partial [Mycena olivaceomarginata]